MREPRLIGRVLDALRRRTKSTETPEGHLITPLPAAATTWAPGEQSLQANVYRYAETNGDYAMCAALREANALVQDSVSRRLSQARRRAAARNHHSHNTPVRPGERVNT